MRFRTVVGVLVLALSVGGTGVATASLPSPPTVVPTFAFVKSVTKVGGKVLLRVDPALFLTGISAEVAASDDGTEAYDFYIRNSDHKLVTFTLGAGAKIWVVSNKNGQLSKSEVAIETLELIAKGKKPAGGYSPSFGWWLTVKGDTVTGLFQQYTP